MTMESEENEKLKWRNCQIVALNENGKLVLVEDNLEMLLNDLRMKTTEKRKTVLFSVFGPPLSGKSFFTNMFSLYLKSKDIVDVRKAIQTNGLKGFSFGVYNGHENQKAIDQGAANKTDSSLASNSINDKAENNAIATSIDQAEKNKKLENIKFCNDLQKLINDSLSEKINTQASSADLWNEITEWRDISQELLKQLKEGPCENETEDVENHPSEIKNAKQLESSVVKEDILNSATCFTNTELKNENISPNFNTTESGNEYEKHIQDAIETSDKSDVTENPVAPNVIHSALDNDDPTKQSNKTNDHNTGVTEPLSDPNKSTAGTNTSVNTTDCNDDALNQSNADINSLEKTEIQKYDKHSAANNEYEKSSTVEGSNRSHYENLAHEQNVEQSQDSTSVSYQVDTELDYTGIYRPISTGVYLWPEWIPLSTPDRTVGILHIHVDKAHEENENSLYMFLHLVSSVMLNLQTDHQSATSFSDKISQHENYEKLKNKFCGDQVNAFFEDYGENTKLNNGKLDICQDSTGKFTLGRKSYVKVDKIFKEIKGRLETFEQVFDNTFGMKNCFQSCIARINCIGESESEDSVRLQSIAHQPQASSLQPNHPDLTESTTNPTNTPIPIKSSSKKNPVPLQIEKDSTQQIVEAILQETIKAQWIVLENKLKAFIDTIEINNVYKIKDVYEAYIQELGHYSLSSQHSKHLTLEDSKSVIENLKSTATVRFEPKVNNLHSTIFSFIEEIKSRMDESPHAEITELSSFMNTAKNKAKSKVTFSDIVPLVEEACTTLMKELRHVKKQKAEDEQYIREKLQQCIRKFYFKTMENLVCNTKVTDPANLNKLHEQISSKLFAVYKDIAGICSDDSQEIVTNLLFQDFQTVSDANTAALEQAQKKIKNLILKSKSMYEEKMDSMMEENANGIQSRKLLMFHSKFLRESTQALQDAILNHVGLEEPPQNYVATLEKLIEKSFKAFKEENDEKLNEGSQTAEKGTSSEESHNPPRPDSKNSREPEHTERNDPHELSSASSAHTKSTPKLSVLSQTSSKISTTSQHPTRSEGDTHQTTFSEAVPAHTTINPGHIGFKYWTQGTTCNPQSWNPGAAKHNYAKLNVKNVQSSGNIYSDRTISSNLPVEQPIHFQITGDHISIGVSELQADCSLKNSMRGGRLIYEHPAKVGLSRDHKWYCGTDVIENQEHVIFSETWNIGRHLLHDMQPIEVCLNQGTIQVTTELLFSVFFTSMKSVVTSQQNVRANTALISVPYWLSSYHRIQIQNAAYMSGFENIYLVNENSAAAFFWNYNFVDQIEELGDTLIISENSEHLDISLYSYNEYEKKIYMEGHSGDYESSDIQKNYSFIGKIKIGLLQYLSTNQNEEVEDTALKNLEFFWQMTLQRASKDCKNRRKRVLICCKSDGPKPLLIKLAKKVSGSDCIEVRNDAIMEGLFCLSSFLQFGKEMSMNNRIHDGTPYDLKMSLPSKDTLLLSKLHSYKPEVKSEHTRTFTLETGQYILLEENTLQKVKLAVLTVYKKPPNCDKITVLYSRDSNGIYSWNLVQFLRGQFLISEFTIPTLNDFLTFDLCNMASSNVEHCKHLLESLDIKRLLSSKTASIEQAKLYCSMISNAIGEGKVDLISITKKMVLETVTDTFEKLKDHNISEKDIAKHLDVITKLALKHNIQLTP